VSIFFRLRVVRPVRMRMEQWAPYAPRALPNDTNGGSATAIMGAAIQSTSAIFKQSTGVWAAPLPAAVLPNGRKHIVTVYSYRPECEAMELLATKRRPVLMESKPFGCGGVSEAFRIWFFRENGVPGPMQVAKRYKFKMGFAEDHKVSQMGRIMAKRFNAKVSAARKPYPTVNFLLWDTIIELEDEFYSIEDFLPGRFTKYNNIFGSTEKVPTNPEEVIQCHLAAAFSHFTWEASGHQYVTLDVQGVGTTYTDVAVVSRTSGKYGYTDTGPDNIVRFFVDHRCNDLCRALDLPAVINMKALPPLESEDPDAKKQEATEAVPKVTPHPAANGAAPPTANVLADDNDAPHEWVYVDKAGTAHRYDPDTLRAIRLAEKQGTTRVKVMVGPCAHHTIDLAAKIHFNFATGDALRLDRRAGAGGRQRLLQVELDDHEWHGYTGEFHKEVLAAVTSGQTKVRLPMCGRDYEFDFEAMVQTNLESGKVRRIRLVEVDL